MTQVNLQEIAIKNMMSIEITDRVIEAMKQACEQAIDLCSENAELLGCKYSHGIEKDVVDLGEEICIDENSKDYVKVNSESILNTKNQIV